LGLNARVSVKSDFEKFIVRIYLIKNRFGILLCSSCDDSDVVGLSEPLEELLKVGSEGDFDLEPVVSVFVVARDFEVVAHEF
jgi:hypothetical protein